MSQCKDLEADRKLGAYWEKQFCILAQQYDKCFTPHQLGKDISALAYTRLNKYTLPDITIWSSPGEHHEIKHKNPNVHDNYGLEKYRFEALYEFWQICNQKIYYTIHDWELAGGKNIKENHIEDWLTTSIEILKTDSYKIYDGYSWVNGVRKMVPIYYWHKSLFIPLRDIWDFNSNTNENTIIYHNESSQKFKRKGIPDL